MKRAGILFFSFWSGILLAPERAGESKLELNNEYSGKIEVLHKEDNTCRFYIRDTRIYTLGLDTLANINFWRKVINLTPDSALINIPASRQIIRTICSKSFACVGTGTARQLYLDSIKKSFSLPDSERVVVTIGKSNYYKLRLVMPDIEKAIHVFEKNNTDPFYAQAILLTESPGQMVKSSAGAYGPFQLMKSVARSMGLTVNKYVDERKDLLRSAYAASKLINRICIPYTNKMLDEKGICYNPDDLWYRLLVLHVYHAGAGNVKKALNIINPCEGNIDLIKKLWQTRAGAFGSASQNYSQITITCMIELDQIIHASSTDIFYTIR